VPLCLSKERKSERHLDATFYPLQKKKEGRSIRSTVAHSLPSTSLWPPFLDLPLASLPRPPLKKKKKKTVQANTTRFMFDGERIGEEHTPAALGLEDGDQIDAMVEQLGGGSEV